MDLGFLHRDRHLSLRKSEGFSLSRLTLFSRLNTVFSRLPQLGDGARVCNLDETGCTNVPKPKNNIVQKGVKQVNQCFIEERGQLVTVAAPGCAKGTFLTPVIVFPRKYHMLQHLIWLDYWRTVPIRDGTFHQEYEQLKENPSILICDNHESHLSLRVLDMAKKAGITMLILPPHTSKRLQTLDLTVFAPFKS
ncbi:hypothetical protein PR048_028435 [Dryococelus australis]|uniref:DDE-1 domain-containing protein n=1 Tax=Dryococelus australis TaxID=614101 RepID=A0ABQ9GAK4_9NEOP|nr:hypothetical protein PR048_028435 [Dryococelus australis]